MKIIPDNDASYLNSLEERIKEVDNKAEILIKESLDGLLIHVLPSLDQLRDLIIRSVRQYHYSLGIKIEFSKSLLISKHITFKVIFGNVNK